MRFATDAEIQQAVTAWLQTQDTFVFYVQDLVSRREEWSNANGDCMKFQFITSATQVQYLHWSQNKNYRN
jgi:hypothetical protein